MRYYFADGNQQRGPFTIDELKSQGIRADTLVWREGMANWQRADTIEELIFARTFTTPEIPPGQPTTAAPTGPIPYASSVQPAPPYNPGDSRRIAAGICGILLGGLGVHKFILGMTGTGILMICITFVGACFTFGLSATAMQIIGLIEGIIYLSKSDEEFYYTYIVRKKTWF